MQHARALARSFFTYPVVGRAPGNFRFKEDRGSGFSDSLSHRVAPACRADAAAEESALDQEVRVTLRFEVNGTAREAARDARCTLVEHLRDAMQLKATRFGCGQEQCGACVVLVDGAPRHACRLELGNLQGRSITTAEALPASREGRALLEAFERLQAAQCGFCLSGILVRALAFLRTSEDGSRGAIAAALDGHLCRCGAHPRILAAIAEAWEATRRSEA